MQQHMIDVTGDGQVLTFPGEYPGHTVVVCLDAATSDGVCRQYLVRGGAANGPTLATVAFQREAEVFQGIQAQQGGNSEGCRIEDMLKILMHHLASLQAGERANNHQAHAMVKLEEAMHWITKQRYVAEPAPPMRP